MELSLEVEPDLPRIFYPLLEQGITIRGTVGCTVQNFLEVVMKLDQQYIRERIQTIFLNFRPVDDLRTAILMDGSHVALSTAMPGLLGATMRKSGRYAAFRSEITQKREEVSCSETQGSVIVKMFNMVAGEIGPKVLKNGFFTDSKKLKDIFQANSAVMADKVHLALLNKKQVETGTLPALLPNSETVFFSVSF